MDTIFAPATAPGRAGVSIVRVSGNEARTLLSHFNAREVKPRQATLRKLVWQGSLIDEALVLFFPKGHSFTGEDVLELQLHGSIAIQRKILECLSSIEGCRMAEAGEFTRRALENGRLDLVQVEGLADLIDAETEAQRLQATRAFQGEFSSRIEQWRSQLIRVAALIEATIDFADEDIPVDVFPEAIDILGSLREEFMGALAGSSFAERLRDGFTVAIVGKPNVGKSTLLNYIAGREAAITSSIAGTTRDIVEVHTEVAGFPVTFLDTAGLRETGDEVEAIGIKRAQQRANDADIRVFLDSVDMEVPYREWDLLCRPKIDVDDGGSPLGISGLTGQGVDLLCSRIGSLLSDRAPTGVTAIQVRQRVALSRASDMLEGVFLSLKDEESFPELIAEDIRTVIREIDVIVGRVGVEDLLDEIFSSFCIGK